MNDRSEASGQARQDRVRTGRAQKDQAQKDQAQKDQAQKGQAQEDQAQEDQAQEGPKHEPPSREGAPRPEEPVPPPLEAVTTVTTATGTAGTGTPPEALNGAPGGAAESGRAHAAGPATAARGGPAPGWTFLTNHAHVLFCLACDGDLTMRELAARVGVTERAVQAIVADLVDGGYVNRARVGRRNSYTVNLNGRMRHPLESKHSIGDLINALL